MSLKIHTNSMVFSGQSRPNSIHFCYGKDGICSALAYYDENDRIQVQCGTKEEIITLHKEHNKQYTYHDRHLTVMMILFPILFIILDIGMIWQHMSVFWIFGAVIAQIFASLPLLSVIHLLFVKRGYYDSEEDMHAFLRCHASEHAVLNDYRHHAFVQDPEHALSVSYLYPECGVVDACQNVIFAISLGVAIVLIPKIGVIGSICIPLIEALLYFILVGFVSWTPLMYLEYLVVEPPTIRETKLAAAALQATLDLVVDGKCPVKSYDQKRIAWYKKNFRETDQ